MENVTLSRNELYDLVWSKPFTTLARKYEISDNGLRKICVRMQIPWPKAGYWQKLQYNKPSEMKKLSINYNGENAVTLKLRAEGDLTNNGTHSPEKLLSKEIENDSSLEIKVPERLTNPHKLVVELKNALAENNTDFRTNLIRAYRSSLGVTVSKDNISRALRIMDTFIKAMEKRGHELQTKNSKSYFLIQGQECEFSMREKTTRVAKPSKYSWQEYDYFPSGVFLFSAKISYPDLEWKDGKLKLEQQLARIIAKLEIRAEESRQKEIKWQRDNEIREEKERIRKAKEKRIEEELLKFKQLKKKAEDWQMANLIRSYLDELKQQAITQNKLNEELKNWLEWAYKKADRYDPIISLKDDLMEGVERGID